MHNYFRPVGLALLGVALLFNAQAQLVVTTNSDSSPGSLRQAITAAQSGDTITFAPALSGQTLSVTNGQILISKSVTLDASALPAGVIINGHGLNRLFHCGSQTTNTFIRLTLTGGRAASGGGAILNDSLLTLNDCTLIENRANEGGAIFQFDPVTLNNCTLVSNYARFGGAIENDGFRGPLTLNNCTLAHNVATNDGGAIHNFFTVILNHCTVVSNISFWGGGISDEDTLYLTNCIVAGNKSPNNPFTAQIAGSIDRSGGINIIATNVLVSPLGDYGGPTQTMPPLPGSPAIDPIGGLTTSAFATDQRGRPRVINDIVDVGAVEVQLSPSTPIMISSAELFGDGTFQLSFSNVTGGSFSVLASTNLVLPISNWPLVGPVTETPPGSGQFQFTDAQATNHPQRFYRVRSP